MAQEKSQAISAWLSPFLAKRWLTLARLRSVRQMAKHVLDFVGLERSQFGRQFRDVEIAPFRRQVEQLRTSERSEMQVDFLGKPSEESADPNRHVVAVHHLQSLDPRKSAGNEFMHFVERGAGTQLGSVIQKYFFGFRDGIAPEIPRLLLMGIGLAVFLA